VLALLSPGQGAQTPGMLAPWLDLPEAAARLRWLSAVSGLDLIRLGTTAEADEIRDTAVTQPLLIATALAAAAELDLPAASPELVTAGHSVGELGAAALAGVLSAEAAVALARIRGAEMAAACALARTGMSAVLGGDPEAVIAGIEALGLTPANVNGAGQIVAAGTAEQLAALAEDKPEGVRRVVPLKVAGAFHTDHMAPAVATLEDLVAGVPIADPGTAYVSNRDGAVVASGAEVIQRMVAQVSNPVRWDLCMETFQKLGVTAMIEVAPGGTLTGIAKRALPGVATLALKTPDDLEAARALIAEHAVPADTPAV
jgi:[acyl-carrier-protein] S-malonyltransferase